MERSPELLPARDAYRLWAPIYGRESAVSALDERVVRELTPPLAGTWLLDAGCGTGRRLPKPGPRGPRRVIGVDLVSEMLRAARPAKEEAAPGSAIASPPLLAAADVRALPFADATFDVVWCRLVLGHVPRLDPAYSELARVSRPGACIIVTDFHPRAVHAGHARTFRDAAGHLHAVEHHVHFLVDHERAAGRVGLQLGVHHDLEVGPEVQRFYEEARMLDAYDAQRGLPLVLALTFQR